MQCTVTSVVAVNCVLPLWLWLACCGPHPRVIGIIDTSTTEPSKSDSIQLVAMSASVPVKKASWPLLRTAGMGFIGGVLVWGAGDVLGEFTTFLKLREKGISLANQSQELKDQIGHPFAPGPWYNASIGFTAGGSIAQCTFQLKGTQQITDVTVRGLRSSGIANRALYNLIGSGSWTIVDCTAMFPAGGGLVQPKSLLPKTQQGAGSDASADELQGPATPAGAAQAPASTTTPDAQPPGQPGKEGPSKSSWWPWGRSKSGNKGQQALQDSSSGHAKPAT